MSTQPLADPLGGGTAVPERETASADLRRDLLSCSRYLALLAAELERDPADAAAPSPSATCRLLEAELASTLSLRLGETDPEHLRIDVAATVTRVIEHALAHFEGRTEEEERLRDWIELLQSAALPLLPRLPVRPRFAEVRFGGLRGPTAHPLAWSRTAVRTNRHRLAIVPHEENQGIMNPEQTSADAERPAGSAQGGATMRPSEEDAASAGTDEQPESTASSAQPHATGRRRLRVVPGRPPLSEARAAEIRARILRGAYNSLAMVDELARRILRRGDV
jgi:hypothetical protein